MGNSQNLFALGAGAEGGHGGGEVMGSRSKPKF